MPKFFIKTVEIKNMWGYQDFDITFNDQVNIIIGPNASGKTSILKILSSIFTGKFSLLNDIHFGQVILGLRQFDDKKKRKTIEILTTENGYKLKISGKTYRIRRDLIERFHFDTGSIRFMRRHSSMPDLFTEFIGAVEELKDLVPLVWLPVSRRLPISDEEDEMMVNSHDVLESVDARLRDLQTELVQYRLRLDARLSELYEEFQKEALLVFLYNEQYDSFNLRQIEPPSEEDKKQLLEAFKVAGLYDKEIRERIDAHFDIAEENLTSLAEKIEAEGPIEVKDIFFIPLLGRTNSIIKSAQLLEEEREQLFKPLRKYEESVKSFLKEKDFRVEDSGELLIESKNQEEELSVYNLSSGEKQILILLSEALLCHDDPLVYIADEPELSLHVSWQEKLLQSLLELGGKIQIIVATHSPDIVGPYLDNVIQLGE